MPRTSTKPTLIPGRRGPVANNPPKSQQSGTPGVRSQQRQPSEWNPTTWNSREPEKAVRKPAPVPAEVEDENSGDQKKPKLIAYPDKPKPLDTTDVDRWPEKAR